jgi:hypothetical protein
MHERNAAIAITLSPSIRSSLTAQAAVTPGWRQEA